MERKRQRSDAFPDTVQLEQQLEGASVEGPSTRRPKLILKPPKFLTSNDEPQQDLDSLLEKMLDLDTAVEVLEHLLRLMDTHKVERRENSNREEMVSTEVISKSLSALGKLAKSYREEISLCCVLVHTLEMLATHWREVLGGSIPKNLQSFVLSLLDHGEQKLRRDHQH